MRRSLIWRFSLYAAIGLFAILLVVPTMISNLPQWWNKILPDEVLHEFTIALIVGVTTGTYSTVYIASPVVLFWEQHIGAQGKKRA